MFSNDFYDVCKFLKFTSVGRELLFLGIFIYIFAKISYAMKTFS